MSVAEIEPLAERVRDTWRAVWRGETAPPVDFDTKVKCYYQGNPAGPIHVLQLTTGEAREVIGMVSLAPRLFWVDGRACTFAMPCDFVIRRDYRFALPALVLQRRAQALALSWFSGTYSLPGTRAAPIFKRLGGMREITRGRWVCVLDYGNVLRERMAAPVAIVLGGMIDAAARCREAVTISLAKQRWRATWVDRFDDRFDALWRRFDRRGLAIGDRSRQFLSWRFAKDLAPERRALIISQDSGASVSAYIIGIVRAKVFYIDDLFTDLDVAQLQPALVSALGELRRSGVARVSIWLLAPEWLTGALARAGFRQRDTDIAYIRTNATISPLAAECEFYLTSADEDT